MRKEPGDKKDRYSCGHEEASGIGIHFMEKGPGIR